ncbi:MAG TPA: PilZ domain-containing protein [Polyangiaceae bacterium]|jgi:uncharacterized protein (TIGR02266 family)|nr:PilZ domain-containing protein [Polyangiaceae bacterium]
MPDERRSARRALLSGVHATYESATGERHQVLVSDLSKDGLFLQTESLLAVGKRLSLEISVTGEPAPWAALGRVVWTRSGRDPGGSSGMGVKFIDVEETVLAAIERLVASRTSAAPATTTAAPPREKTMLGVGLAPRPPVPGSRVPREKTVLGIGLAATPIALSAPAQSEKVGEDEAVPAREASLTIDLVARREPSDAIDLVAKKSPVPAPVTERLYAKPNRGPVNETAAPLEEEEDLPPLPKRRTGWVLLAFVIVAAAAIMAYAFRDRLRQLRFAIASRAELFACEATSAPGPGSSWTVGRDGEQSARPPARLER